MEIRRLVCACRLAVLHSSNRAVCVLTLPCGSICEFHVLVGVLILPFGYLLISRVDGVQSLHARFLFSNVWLLCLHYLPRWDFCCDYFRCLDLCILRGRDGIRDDRLELELVLHCLCSWYVSNGDCGDWMLIVFGGAFLSDQRFDKLQRLHGRQFFLVVSFSVHQLSIRYIFNVSGILFVPTLPRGCVQLQHGVD